MGHRARPNTIQLVDTTMKTDLFERLLNEEESATLDFKKEQYRFAKADDNEKSELLKDLLGFVNAWRRSQAYILVGVDDVRGGRGLVVGIPSNEQLPDHSLQQFVNSLTNQPVQFHYEAFVFEGKQVGIFVIEEQARPIFLNRDFGKLRKGEVYVRRGSSTDPSKPASPDEIAKMGSNLTPSPAEISVEFADPVSERGLGQTHLMKSELCRMPANEIIPDHTRYDRSYLREAFVDFGIGEIAGRPNYEYFRELAHHEFMHRLFRPVRFVVQNVGRSAANDVRVEILCSDPDLAQVISGHDLPSEPTRYYNYLDPSGFRSIASVAHDSFGEVSITKKVSGFELVIECGNLQPGRRILSDIVYVGMKGSGSLSMVTRVYAANLPQPMDSSLSISMQVKETTMSVGELTLLGRVRHLDS